MGRGLSQLQKTILEMAHERFIGAMDDHDAEKTRGGRPKGIWYEVYVGPALPSPSSLTRWNYENSLIESRLNANPFEDPDKKRDTVRGEVQAEIGAEVERIAATRREVEGKTRTAAPELWEKPEDNYYAWSPPCWSCYYEGRDGLTYERFKLASFTNNAAEARRYRRLIDERGLKGTYHWRGGGEIYTGEILERAYGFTPKYKFEYWPWGQRNAIKFDPAKIGQKRYNAARASVSRALDRLHNRMLIEHTYNGIATITLEGIAALTGKTVKEVCTQHKVNQTDGDRRLLIKGEPEREPNPESEKALTQLQGLFNG